MVELFKIAQQPKAYTKKEKLDAIREACKPCQDLNISQAIDLICDIYLASRQD